MTFTLTRGEQPAPASGPPAVHRLRPLRSLDGLRGLAVAAVVAFHYPIGPWVRGGLFGVGVFFVLSGFLVTAGLLDQADGSDRVDVFGFLRRRAWRLLPALAVLLAVFVVLAAGFRHQPWFSSNPFGNPDGSGLRMSTAWAGVGIAASWWYNLVLARSWAAPSPLGHLWTLSLEVQFYVGVVLAVWAAVRFRRRSWLLPAALGLAAVSAGTPWLLWHHGQGANEIYFGTRTNMQQLLGGAALAMVWRRGGLDRLPRRVLGGLGAAGGAALAWMFMEVGDVTFKYLGALSVVTAATAAVVAYCLRAEDGGTRPPAVRVLSHPVLTWLGRRSYGIYLWHWPLAEWTNRLPHSFGIPLGVGLSLALAEASWRLVEQPAGRLSRRLQDRRDHRPARAAP
ncbi:MAG TPA: acyltransferase [Acidimicrobiales bacterium]|nr:acyltransferase [Acidimicrobiales bacterium]